MQPRCAPMRSRKSSKPVARRKPESKAADVLFLRELGQDACMAAVTRALYQACGDIREAAIALGLPVTSINRLFPRIGLSRLEIGEIRARSIARFRAPIREGVSIPSRLRGTRAARVRPAP